ncbi:hypothetical protein KUCAC02_022496, partial [Chaenocephalus aceratus]
PVHGDDGSLLPEEEDRILRHPDLHAVLMTVILSQVSFWLNRGVRAGEDSV